MGFYDGKTFPKLSRLNRSKAAQTMERSLRANRRPRTVYEISSTIEGNSELIRELNRFAS